MKKKTSTHLAQERKLKREKAQKIHVVSSLKEAMLQIEELEAHVSAIKTLKNAKGNTVIVAKASKNQSEATAFAIATDWHLGSTVRPETVNGLNSYNVAIAKKRIATFFEGVVSLTNKERQNAVITELVLFLGGDMIDGALHMDTIMSAEIAEPIKQAVLCQELIEAGLTFLRDHGKFKRITVVCCDGN